VDAADLGRGQVDLVDLLRCEEAGHRRLVEKVELAVGSCHHVVAQFAQAPCRRLTHHAAMTCNKDTHMCFRRRG
jgi:hypothetical protein